MPRNHKPSKVSQAITWGNGGKYSVPGNGHQCPKSPVGSHWWRIVSPDGVMSIGVCRYCGERREFANTLEAVFRVGSKR